MSTIESLRNAGLLSFDLNYSTGSTIDTVSGNIGTVNAPLSWNRFDKYRGLYLNKTGAVTYPDTVANRLAGGQLTIIGFGNIKPPIGSDNPRIISKRTSGAGNNEYDFFLTSTTFNFFVNATISSVAATFSKYNKFYAVTLVNDSVPKFYLDGSFVGNGNNTLTTSASTKSVIVGNFYGLDPTTVANGTLFRVIGISKALTSEEISDIYEELLSSSIVGSNKNYNFHNTYIKTKTLPKLHWLLDSPKNSPLVATDISGNGYHGTNNQVGYNQGIVANTAVKFQGNINSKITLTNGMTNTIASNDQHTISLWFKSSDYSNLPIVFMSSSGDYYVIILGTGATIRWRIGSSNKDYDNVNLKPNVWYHLVVMKTGTTTGNLYLNGQLVSGTGSLAATGATPGNLILGAFTSSTLHLNGQIQDFRIYDQNLTKQEIDDLYFEGARKLNLYIPMKEEVTESLSYITTYGPIESTPFTVRPNPNFLTSPKYKISSYKNRKYIVYDGTGAANSQLQHIYTQSNQAFGTWIFRVKPPTGYNCIMSFIGDKQKYIPAGGIISTSGSYLVSIEGDASPIIYLGKCTAAGALSNICVTNFTNDYNTVAITRNNFGVFTIYGKLGNADWSLLTATSGTNPTTADLTYTAGAEIMLHMGQYQTYCHFGDFRFHEGVLTLDQIKSLYANG